MPITTTILHFSRCSSHPPTHFLDSFIKREKGKTREKLKLKRIQIEMDNSDETIKIESTGSDGEQEMQIIGPGSVTMIQSTISVYDPRNQTWMNNGEQKATKKPAKVQILPNEDPRVVRAGKGFAIFVVFMY